MKSLKDYLLEEKESVFSNVKKITLDVIDYLYNEGIIAYDDKHLVDYVDGKNDPDYEDIINVMLSDYSKYLTNEAVSLLKKYSSLSEDDKNDIQISILRGISDFVDKGNCRNF